MLPVVDKPLIQCGVEELADRDLVALARERLAHKQTAVEVDIDQI